MARKKKKEIQIPLQLLAQVNEWSFGGYILFTFNEDGDPILNMNFDTAQNAVAMQAHISDWINALQSLRVNGTVNAIINQSKKQS